MMQFSPQGPLAEKILMGQVRRAREKGLQVHTFANEDHPPGICTVFFRSEFEHCWITPDQLNVVVHPADNDWLQQCLQSEAARDHFVELKPPPLVGGRLQAFAEN